jgi:hypothetical protein
MLKRSLPKSCAGTQKQTRNSCASRAIQGLRIAAAISLLIVASAALCAAASAA